MLENLLRLMEECFGKRFWRLWVVKVIKQIGDEWGAAIVKRIKKNSWILLG